LTELSIPASIAAAAAGLRAGEFTAVALTEHCLARISALQPELHAFITVTGEAALAAARERDRELNKGFDRGALHGIPIVHKDCFDTVGVRTTVGADIFRNRVPDTDATVVQRLAAAGAIMLGKTNMNEFAAGMSGKNAFFGDARNPRDTARAAGGSSSGSACAVAARLCLGATGTDAGGSIRLPAAWTGIVGVRPSYGRVSTAGAYPRSFSFDCAGPLAVSVQDAALLLDVMAGPDAHASRAPDHLRGVRIGFIEDSAVHDDVAQALRKALDVLARSGAEVVPATAKLQAAHMDYGVIFDVLLYEFHQILGEQYRATSDREERFGPIVRANLERGASISAADYRAALEARERFVRELGAVFLALDALVTPTAPMTAPALDAPEAVFDQARRFTIPFSFAGLPALSLPCGSDRNGLPIGMQIVGPHLGEQAMLRIAAAYESAAATPASGQGRPPSRRS
jgi:aspartyl-tRNA(Asn)/glutamyl-tRNA(Gln) amidotransferase subunit A